MILSRIIAVLFVSLGTTGYYSFGPVLLIEAVAVRSTTACSTFGLNLSAEIRCLRSMLTQCSNGNKDNRNDQNSIYYQEDTENVVYSTPTGQLQSTVATSRTAPTPTTARTPTTITPEARSTRMARERLSTIALMATTTTTTPTSTTVTSHSHVDVGELRSNLSRIFEAQAAQLESKVDAELRAIESRANQRIEAIKLKSESEIHKLQTCKKLYASSPQRFNESPIFDDPMLSRGIEECTHTWFYFESLSLQKTLKLMTRRPHRLGGFEYIYMDDRENWYVAEEQCVRWGGHLASIATTEENHLIQKMHSWFVWTGLNDIQRENRYVWTDGEEVKLFLWARGQPDNAEHNENCVEQDEDGKWSDSFCFQSRHYVCKRRTL